jgi:hypothetical protein
VAEVDESVRKTIALHNADDCFSIRSSRNWLERESLGLGQAGKQLVRPQPSDGAASEVIEGAATEIAELVEKFVNGVSADTAFGLKLPKHTSIIEVKYATAYSVCNLG